MHVNMMLDKVYRMVPRIFFIYSRWAMQEGYGAKLIRTPALIKDIVRQTVSRVPGLPVSIKIRIHDDARYTETSFPESLILERRETLGTMKLYHKIAFKEILGYL